MATHEQHITNGVSANIISQVQIGGAIYELHDKYAAHNAADLGLSAALVFKGILATESELPAASKETAGFVYLVRVDKDGNADVEFVCTEQEGIYDWERLGYGVIDDAGYKEHTHNVTIPGNPYDGITDPATDEVTYNVTTVSPSKTHLSATGTAAAQADFVTSVTPTTDTGKGVGTVNRVKLGVETTPGTAVTGLNTPTTATAITGLNTGSASKINATEIPTYTLANKTASKVTPKEVSIPQYTFADKTASKATAATAITATAVSIPNVTKVDPVSIPQYSFTNKTATNTVFGTATTAHALSATSIPTYKTESRTATKINSYGTPTAVNHRVEGETLILDWTPGSAPSGTNVNVSEVTAGTPITASAVTVPVVTSNDAVTASSATAGTALNASAVTLGTALSADKLSARSISQYTFADVTASAATATADIEFNAVASATDVTATLVTAGTPIEVSEVTVATGTKSSDTFIKSITAATANFLQSAQLAEVTTGGIEVAEDITTTDLSFVTGVGTTTAKANTDAIKAVTIKSGAAGDVEVVNGVTTGATTATATTKGHTHSYSGTIGSQTVETSVPNNATT